MSNEKAIYVPGSAKARQASFGEVIRLSFPVAKLVPFLQQHANEKGYVNVELTRRHEPGQFGDTHTMKLDTWKPDASKAKRPFVDQMAAPIDDDEIGF